MKYKVVLADTEEIVQYCNTKTEAEESIAVLKRIDVLDGSHYEYKIIKE